MRTVIPPIGSLSALLFTLLPGASPHQIFIVLCVATGLSVGPYYVAARTGQPSGRYLLALLVVLGCTMSYYWGAGGLQCLLDNVR
ncbi:hypothetical protein GCM10027417_11950 [Glutamicibacter endophyticus]